MDDPNVSDRVKVLGLSDPLLAPTGFGRVARELFQRLPQDEFDLGYMAFGWAGTRRFPGVATYATTSRHPLEQLCQRIFPVVVNDFAGQDRFVLWTLLDPWQCSWIALPQTSPLSHPASRKFVEDRREAFSWVGYFTLDGAGPRDGPPRWVEMYLDAADFPVMMSEWARRLCQPWCKKELRYISHAAGDRFYPDDQEKARRSIEQRYEQAMERALRARSVSASDAAISQAVRDGTFRMDDRFTVGCVMANRERKYWPTVLRAFRMVVDHVPSARFLGMCSDRTGQSEDAWPLEDICADLGLRLGGDDPNVCLIEFIGDGTSRDDDGLRAVYNASDVVVLLSGGEGFGLPQLESHACGRPCIVGDYSASSELAVDPMELITPRAFLTLGQNEIQRPVYEAGDLAERVIFAARNPGWRAEVGAAGVMQGNARRWDRILPQWLDVLREAGLERRKEDADAVPTPVARP